MTIIEKVKLLDSDLEKMVLSGPLSRVTTYALRVTGQFGVKEMDNLIRILQLHRDWLKEDDLEPVENAPIEVNQ